MLVSKVLPRVLRSGVRAIASSKQELLLSRFNGAGSLLESNSLLHKWVPCSQFVHQSVLGNVSPQWFWFSSSASPQPNEKEPNQFTEEQGTAKDTDKNVQNISQGEKNTETANASENEADQTEDSGSNPEPILSKSQSVKKRRRSTKRIAFSDSDAEGELSIDDLVKLVAEKEELLKAKHKEIERMQDKVLRSYADMENVIDRTKREAENSKKFAIQNFAKSLLDVADNLGRASSVVRESFSKIDSSEGAVGAVSLLKTLLEGVEMTEKQLAEAFRKYGVEKFDPLNEHFDPHRHLAVFQVPDASKPPGTVATVLKSGYVLYDRVIRPAEVGVTQGVSSEAESET